MYPTIWKVDSRNPNKDIKIFVGDIDEWACDGVPDTEKRWAVWVTIGEDKKYTSTLKARFNTEAEANEYARELSDKM